MLFTCEDREQHAVLTRKQHVIPASHDLTNVIYRGVAGKEKGGQGRAPSPYQLLLDKLVKSNLLGYLFNMKLEPQKISSIKCVVSLRPRTTILYTISLGFMFL